MRKANVTGTAMLLLSLGCVAILLSCSGNDNPVNQSPAQPLTCVINQASPDHGAAPLSVSFEVTATGGQTPYTYSWVFGDGESANVHYPSHTYTSAGQYAVSVTVYGHDGEQASDDTIITVSSPATTADLVVHPGIPMVLSTQVQAGGSLTLLAGSVKNEGQLASGAFAIGCYLSTDSTITSSDQRLFGFSSQGLAANAAFSWGQQAALLSASLAPGTYYVGLWADEGQAVNETNEQNNKIAVKITVQGATPTLSCAATANPQSGVAPLSVNFTLTGSGGQTPYTYSWQFGDGQSSTAQNLSHVYSTAGQYTAVATLTDAVGATCSKQFTISVSRPGITCTATVSPLAGQAPLVVALRGSATGGTAPYRYAWVVAGKDTLIGANFNYTFSRAGTYRIDFGAMDANSDYCTKQFSVVVTAPSALSCSAGASPTAGTVPLNVAFTGSANGGTPPYQYLWNFNDGGSSTQQNPSHSFTSPGRYAVSLVVTDAQSANARDTVFIDVTAPALNCTGSANPTSGLAPLTVGFTSGGSGGQTPYTYSWQFGDGQSSTAQNPSHVYSTAGTYTATATVKDAQNVTCSKSFTITVSAGSLSCTATGSPTSGTAPLTVNFGVTATGGTTPYTYSWQFGDGQSSTTQNPGHTYQSAGTYLAVVTVTGANAATAKDTVTVNVTQPATGPVLTGPSNSSGTFNLSWTFGWPPLASSNDKVSVEEKVGSGSFAEISQVYRSGGSGLQLTRTAGTYSYRVRAYYEVAGSGKWSAYSNTVTVQVSAPVSKARFTNNSTYFVVSLKIDNVEQFLVSPNGLLPGYYYELELAPGPHSYVALYGFWNEYGGREYLYQYSGTFTQRSGVTEQISFTSPTVNQLLTKFNTTGTWSAWVPGELNKVKFRFNANGTFTFTNLQGQTTNGTYAFVSRNGTAWTVTFSAGGYQATLYEFLDYFVMSNGPGNTALQYFYDGL